MSGNCATGMRVSASNPASVVTMAMTIASRGLLMNTDDSMRQPRPGGGDAGAGATAAFGRAR